MSADRLSAMMGGEIWKKEFDAVVVNQADWDLLFWWKTGDIHVAADGLYHLVYSFRYDAT